MRRFNKEVQKGLHPQIRSKDSTDWQLLSLAIKAKAESFTFVIVFIWIITMILIATSACTTSGAIHSKPITGFSGRQCALEPRVVVCNSNLSAASCEAVWHGVNLINKAAKQNLLKFEGYVYCDVDNACIANAIEKEKKIVVVAAETLTQRSKDNPTKAQTLMQLNPRNGCIGSVFIEQLMDLGEFSALEIRQVFTHELLHALGISHNNWLESNSVMTPSMRAATLFSEDLPEADLNALKALYGDN